MRALYAIRTREAGGGEAIFFVIMVISFFFPSNSFFRYKVSFCRYFLSKWRKPLLPPCRTFSHKTEEVLP